MTRSWFVISPWLAMAGIAICIALLALMFGGNSLGGLEDQRTLHPWVVVAAALVGLAILAERPTRKSAIATALAGAAGALALTCLVSPFGVHLPGVGYAPMTSSGAAGLVLLLSVALVLKQIGNPGLAQFVALIAAYFPLFTILRFMTVGTTAGALPALAAATLGFLLIGAALGRMAHRRPLRALVVVGPRGRSARNVALIAAAASILLLSLMASLGAEDKPELFAIEAAAIVVLAVLTVFYLARTMDRSNARTRSADGESAMSADLRGAWDRGEINLQFQPQVSLASGALTGVEVLASWAHPVRGHIPPAEFIPVAERYGTIVPLGDWILQTACMAAAAWDGSLGKAKVAVNVSALQLANTGFADVVADALRRAKLAPDRLVLEVTESSMMRQGDAAVTVLRTIRDTGVRVAIDDFGTGFSSLSYLRLLPSDYLKIDQSFVRDLTHDPNAAAITRSIIALGHTLGLRILAEGIETKDQAEFLQASWCDEGQGYLYSHPLSETQLMHWARARQIDKLAS